MGAFRALDLTVLKQVMAGPIIVDLRNIYSSAEITRHGFTYAALGSVRARRKQLKLRVPAWPLGAG